MSNTTSKSRFRRFIIIVGLIGVFLLISEHQRQHPTAPNVPAPPNSAQSQALDEISDGPDSVKTWSVISHRGYNSDFGCWILRLNRATSGGETSSDYCAQSKADYDNHADGSSYTTRGSWLDDIVQHAQPSDHA